MDINFRDTWYCFYPFDPLPPSAEYKEWYKRVQSLLRYDFHADASLKSIKKHAAQRGFDPDGALARLFEIIYRYVFPEKLPDAWYCENDRILGDDVEQTRRFRNQVLLCGKRITNGQLLVDAHPNAIVGGAERVSLLSGVNTLLKVLEDENDYRKQSRRCAPDVESLCEVCVAAFLFTGQLNKYTDITNLVNIGLEAGRSPGRLKRDTIRKTVSRFRKRCPRVWEWLLESVTLMDVIDLFPSEFLVDDPGNLTPRRIELDFTAEPTADEDEHTYLPSQNVEPDKS
jgi:hypothetical protein